MVFRHVSCMQQCQLIKCPSWPYSGEWICLQTLVRYKLPVVVIIFNNGGVYGGDRRPPEDLVGPHKDDPAPTSFVPGARYDLVMEAFGGKGYLVGNPEELKAALKESFAARKPAVINVTIDPYAGSESGRMGHRN